MGCLTITTGLFIPLGGWNGGTQSTTTANGASVSNVAATGLTVSKNGVSRTLNAATPNTTHYLVFGTPINFVLGCRFDGGAASVVLYEITASGVTEHSLGFVSSTQLPVVSQSPGNGSLFLIVYHNAATGVTPLICRSDNGDTLVSAVNFFPSNVIHGEAVNTAALPKKLRILDGGTQVAIADWPIGNCDAIPNTLNFPDVVIGAGVPAALTTKTMQGKIKNTGNDCLTVSSVSNNAPFSIVAGSYSKPMPVQLAHNEELTFDVLFNPGTTVGSPFNKDLNINPTPPAGDVKITCRGVARAPQLNISTNAPVNFGSVRVGTSSTKPFRITNTGEANISLLTFPASTTPDYSWIVPALPAVIPYGSFLDINITFTPTADATLNRSITFTTTAASSPHTASLLGKGCLPNPIISLVTSIVDLGEVQRGFRTVRMFTIRNTGDGPLDFNADIQPAVPGDPNSIADAGLFGFLEDESTPVVSPVSNFTKTIHPVTPCGALTSGTGQYQFGIAFFAGGGAAIPVPRTVNAILRIFNHNDASAASSFLINLTAVITNPISVDVELVIDRSGSMGDPSGSRVKIETARDAARLFVQLSRADVDDRLGLVRFNNTPEIVSSIQAITSGNQGSIANMIDASNFSPTGATCIAGGVIVAENDIINHPRGVVPPQLNKVILVLTDGHDNTAYLNPVDGIRYSLLGGFQMDASIPFIPQMTQPLPVPTDMKIYALGIGDDIDVGRLGQLATSTGGAFLHTREFSGTDYFNLEKHFTQVYMEAVNYAQIEDPVFQIIPGETHQFDFEVLQGDKSAMVVIYDREGIRLPFWILTPLGEMIDLITVPPGFQIRPGISPTARFIEVNMPQNQPERYRGTWKVILKHDKRACRSDAQGHNAAGSVNVTDDFGSGFQPKHCKDNYELPIMYGIAIGVISNFSMIAFVTPGIVRMGEPILLTANISEFGLPVKGCIVTVEAKRPDGTITNHVLFDDGNHQDDQADDGSYAILYPHTYQEGTYTFTFTAAGKSRDNKPMQRKLVRSKYVEGRDPLVPTNPNGGSGGVKDECCRTISLWIRLGVVLLFIIIILLILIWRS